MVFISVRQPPFFIFSSCEPGVQTAEISFVCSTRARCQAFLQGITTSCGPELYNFHWHLALSGRQDGWTRPDGFAHNVTAVQSHLEGYRHTRGLRDSGPAGVVECTAVRYSPTHLGVGARNITGQVRWRAGTSSLAAGGPKRRWRWS